FFFPSRRRHTRFSRDWSSDVCSSDLEPDDRIAVFAFTLDGIHPHDIATILDAEGIAIRAGHHCAQLLVRRLGVGSTARASCFVYTAPEELDRLVDGLETARGIFAG